MNGRRTAATLAASVVLSTGIGFGLSQASQPDGATAAGGSSAIVKELKKLSSEQANTTAEIAKLNGEQAKTTAELVKVNDALGTTFLADDVIHLLDDIKDNTAP